MSDDPRNQDSWGINDPLPDPEPPVNDALGLPTIVLPPEARPEPTVQATAAYGRVSAQEAVARLDAASTAKPAARPAKATPTATRKPLSPLLGGGLYAKVPKPEHAREELFPDQDFDAVISVRPPPLPRASSTSDESESEPALASLFSLAPPPLPSMPLVEFPSNSTTPTSNALAPAPHRYPSWVPRWLVSFLLHLRRRS